MEASDIKRMLELEYDMPISSRCADLSLENRALKDVIEKKALRPAEERELICLPVSSMTSSSVVHAQTCT